ncbi:MAG TPA: hypothetical protein EYO62_03450 [Aquificales bacterium]|nr:hypothetical protein [Aquificales bacterium]
MFFVEIAPDYYINAYQIGQFRLIHSPERGGFVWVFTLISGKVLFSIPFNSREEAERWLGENFGRVKILSPTLKERHVGYRPE